MRSFRAVSTWDYSTYFRVEGTHVGRKFSEKSFRIAACATDKKKGGIRQNGRGCILSLLNIATTLVTAKVYFAGIGVGEKTKQYQNDTM